MKNSEIFKNRMFVLCVSLMMLLSGSGVADTQPDGGGVGASFDAEGFTVSYEYAQEDSDAEWSASSATTVAFGGDTAQISGDGALFSNGNLTISQAGAYVLTGALDDGQILIDAGKKDIVRLVLGGVSLHCETGPAIYAPQSGKVILILLEGTENIVSDGAIYAAIESGDDPDAAIYVQDDLSITGGGTLRVIGAMQHGIRTQDILAITGGKMHVTAVGDALRGRDGVAIQSGDFTLVAQGDGIQSNNANSDDVGFVLIQGGSFSIMAENDGIQAESSLTIAAGDFQITTGGGSASAPQQEEDFRGGWGRSASNTATTQEDSVSKKALKAGKLMYIIGGSFVIDAEDDAVHSNDTVLITAGDFSIRTGDDAFHADAALQIGGGKIDILSSYEGIEGLSVTIGGGDILIVASDDAINAAGGADSASQAGGPMGRDSFSASGDIFVRITGGSIDAYAPHDGIDSNGDVFIEGGAIKISGPSQGMEGAIDLDGRLTITGGELITAGSVLNVSQDSTQPVILVSYDQQNPSGSVITVKDASGNTLLEYMSRINYALSGFTSPQFTVGETYVLYIDGEKLMDIRLDAIQTSVGSGGGAYNGGRGGGRGNWEWNGDPNAGGGRGDPNARGGRRPL